MNDSGIDFQTKTPVAKRATGRFTKLLLALFLLLFIAPFIELLPGESKHFFGQVVFGAAFALVLLATALAVSESRLQRRVTLMFVASVLIVFVAEKWVDSSWLKILQVGLPIVFLGHSVVLIVKYSFRQNVVESDTVSASLCGYLLIGICFSNVFSLLVEIDPTSFYFSHSVEGAAVYVPSKDANAVTSLYFSFVTLTTVGYGDITPATGFSRMLTAAEGLLGQIYLVVLVARLVGLHVAQSRNTGQNIHEK